MTESDDGEARPRHSAVPEAAVRDHLANERTLLAWQRTALGIIAIGFLVDRFSLEEVGSALAGSLLGIGLVILGAVVSGVGVHRFVRTEREIDTQTYRPAIVAHLALTVAIVIGALALVIYLLATLD